MFRPLSLFSSIPCPNKSKCSLLNCIFSHDADPIVSQTGPTKAFVSCDGQRSFGDTIYRERSCESTDSSESGGVSVANYLAEEEIIGQGRTKRRKVEDKDEGSESGSSTASGGVPITSTEPRSTNKTTDRHVRNATDQASEIQLSHKKAAVAKKLIQGKAPAVVAASASEIVNKKASEATPPPTYYASGNRQIQIVQALRQQKESRQGQSTASPSSNSAQAAGLQAPGVIAKSVALNPRPLIRAPDTPQIRLQLLKLLHGEYVRLYDVNIEDSDVIKLALDEEEKVAIEKKAIYSNVMKSRITALKKLVVEDYTDQREELRKRKGKSNNISSVKMSGPSRAATVAAGGAGGFNQFPLLSSGNSVVRSIVDDIETCTTTDTEPPDYKPVNTGLPVQEELNCLLKLLHSTEDLTKHGYTMNPPTDKEVEDSRKGIAMSAGYEECDRCQTRFRVFPDRDPDGRLASGGKCTYHWGRAIFPPRVKPFNPNEPGGNQRIYTCCSQYIGDSLGCVTAENHVYKVSDIKRLATNWQFVKTPPNPYPSKTVDEYFVPMVQKAYCLDCEMCYTTHGMEVVRLTLTDWPSGARVIDALVRPFGYVMDLNSRFSGVSSKEFSEAKPFISNYSHIKHSIPQIPDTQKPAKVIFDIVHGIDERLHIFSSPQAAREELFKYLTPDTPLIGHALENDLNVLRTIHEKVVDTSILFPHKKPFPVRNKLKWLVDKYLQYTIQVSEIGHDSAIDARCAGELVRYRIKEKWGPYIAGEVGIIKDVAPGLANEKAAVKKIERVSPEELQAKAGIKRQQHHFSPHSDFTVADALRRVEEAEREKTKAALNILTPLLSDAPANQPSKTEPLIKPTSPMRLYPAPVPSTEAPILSFSGSQFLELKEKETNDDLANEAFTPALMKGIKPTYAAALKGNEKEQGQPHARSRPSPTSAVNSVVRKKIRKTPFLIEEDDK